MEKTMEFSGVEKVYALVCDQGPFALIKDGEIFIGFKIVPTDLSEAATKDLVHCEHSLDLAEYGLSLPSSFKGGNFVAEYYSYLGPEDHDGVPGWTRVKFMYGAPHFGENRYELAFGEIRVVPAEIIPHRKGEIASLPGSGTIRCIIEGQCVHFPDYILFEDRARSLESKNIGMILFNAALKPKVCPELYPKKGSPEPLHKCKAIFTEYGLIGFTDGIRFYSNIEKTSPSKRCIRQIQGVIFVEDLFIELDKFSPHEYDEKVGNELMVITCRFVDSLDVSAIVSYVRGGVIWSPKKLYLVDALVGHITAHINEELYHLGRMRICPELKEVFDRAEEILEDPEKSTAIFRNTPYSEQGCCYLIDNCSMMIVTPSGLIFSSFDVRTRALAQYLFDLDLGEDELPRGVQRIFWLKARNEKSVTDVLEEVSGVYRDVAKLICQFSCDFFLDELLQFDQQKLPKEIFSCLLDLRKKDVIKNMLKFLKKNKILN
jgi:hypothetical protein